MHHCDARVKIACLLAFSIAVLIVHTWWGLGVLCVLLAACIALAKLPVARMSAYLVPVYVLAAFTVLFTWLANQNVDGLVAGLFVAIRMISLVAGSFVVCFTTTSEQLLAAFRSMMEPLRALHVPVDDIAFTLALSVRFIPQIGEELSRIRVAQISRGAQTSGSFSVRLRNWGAAFASLFVGLFRHADALSAAMDARCYGAAEKRGALASGRASVVRVVGTLTSCAALIVVGVLL